MVISAPQAFAAHASPITVAEFSGSGDRLVTCDGTGVVLLWSNLAAPKPEAWTAPVLSPLPLAASAVVNAKGHWNGNCRRLNGVPEEETEEEKLALATAMALRNLPSGDRGEKERGVGRERSVRKYDGRCSQLPLLSPPHAGLHSIHPPPPPSPVRMETSGESSTKVPWFLDLPGEEEEKRDNEETGKGVMSATAGAVTAAARLCPATISPAVRHGSDGGIGKGFASLPDQTSIPAIPTATVAAARGGGSSVDGFKRAQVSEAEFFLSAVRARVHASWTSINKRQAGR